MSGIFPAAVNSALRVNDNGTIRTATVLVHHLEPAANYVTGGITVDLSSTFSRIVAVTLCNVYLKSSGAPELGRIWVLGQTGTDTWTSGKFRMTCFTGPSHTHTYDKTNTPTGTQSAEGPIGAVDHTHALTFTSTASGGASQVVFVELPSGDVRPTLIAFDFLVLGVPV